MTARHATPILAAEINCAGGGRELTLRTCDGLIPEELILDGRPSPLSPDRTALTIDAGDGFTVWHLTTTQLVAMSAFIRALLDDVQARRFPT